MPEIVMPATRSVGAAVEVLSCRSSPTASTALSMASSVDEMVISLTGNASSPFSIQKPAAPREKSPVIGLKPKPISSVTYSPRCVLLMISAAGVVPASRMKLLVEAPIEPPLRLAEPVDSRPSLRAL